jgi:acetyltransferase-like isoleucine patch superfamily enzyme
VTESIHERAIVCTDRIGKNVTVSEFAVVREGTDLGDNVTIHPHVVIEKGVRIAEGVEIFPGSYVGKRPDGAGATSRPIRYDPTVSIGSNCRIGPNAVIFYDVEIGQNTLIGDGASIREQVRIGDRCVISRYVTVNYNTIIGSRTKIMDLTHITGNCRVGDDVFIGALVSTANDNALTSRKYTERDIGPTISNKSTIGNGAIILPGVLVGEGAVVGAGSVVTRDVEPFHLVMGVPARVVREIKNEGESGT